ncbi:MAG: glutamine amidotransferase, partial [Gammaproteobacteria bacterium]|nr:glutamine amidotransferase [Gammaproteobacteria bacterium]
MRRTLALRHVAFEHLGSIERVLRTRGHEIQYIEVGQQDLSTLDPLAPDLVVILGGPIGAYEDESYPFLRQELEIIEIRLDRGLPVLGLCLGSQLIARALNARV